MTRIGIVCGGLWWAGWLLALAACAGARAQSQETHERPLCAPEVGARCARGDYALDEYFYTINGKKYMVNFVEGSYYKTRCDGFALDDPALPRFPRPMRFERIKLVGCAPPANASYAAALRANNVDVGRIKRFSLLWLPAGAALSAAALAGLPPALASLELSAAPAAGLLQPAPGLLAAFAALNSLTLSGVRPDRLPPRLDSLRLTNTGIEELPPEALAVVTLEVSERQLRAMEGPAPRLRTLWLAGGALPALQRLPALQSLALVGWDERAPPPLTHCARLRNLTLAHVAAERLPRGFVAACGSLRLLELQSLRAVRDLPTGLLLNATLLESFKIADSNFSTLPDDLFAYSPNLRDIELARTGLQSLPRGLFSALGGTLERLSLAGNSLSALDVETVLSPLLALRVLNLSRNPLRDLCPGGSSQLVARRLSPLAGMQRLEALQLSRTGLTHVCADWLTALQRLQRLDLTHNAVAELACADLAVQRVVAPADIDLSGNPLVRVLCSRDDYDRAADLSIPAKTAKLVTDARLTCDCEAYWLARMVRERRVGVQWEPRCGDAGARGLALRDVPLGRLACALPPAACAPRCACEYAPHAAGLRARCAAPLPDLAPALARLQRAGPPLRELRAPAAGVRRLPDHLPDELQLLDLADNEITNASETAAQALVAAGRRVNLARNPLACACDARALPDALAAHRAQLLEYAATACADGRAPHAALRDLRCDVSARLPALAAVAVVVAAALLLGALLARPETRLRLKALLHARGVRGRWLTRRPDPPDADRPFDAFVAHAEADERFVAEQLAARLEPARRLCLAYRDWPAGAWIPAMIEESVRRSRVTLCVVSRAALASPWLRAALRAAHAQALRPRGPRLLLLLRDADAAQDADLRATLRLHRALRWGERCCWEQLLYALPDPRPPAPLPPAAA